MAKVLSAAGLSSVGMVMIGILGIALLKMPLDLVLLMIIVGTLGILFTSFIGIFIDLNFPKLHWDTEQRAVKQNLNVLISMVICIAIAGFTMFIILKLKLTKWTVFALILVVYATIDAVLYYLLGTKGAKMLREMES